MAKLAGIVGISIDGAPQKVMGQVGFKLGGKVRTMIDGNAVHGFTEKIEAGEITLKIVVDAATDLVGLQAISGSTLTIETDVGTTLVMANSVVKDSIDVSIGSGENEATIIFGGDPIESTS